MFDNLRMQKKIYTFADRIPNMQITFEETYLKDLYTKGTSSDKKHRYQPQVIRGYQKAVKFLIAANQIEDLFPIKSLHIEALHGNKEGLFSVRANDQYRVEFSISQEGPPVITVCNIITLSNHYK